MNCTLKKFFRNPKGGVSILFLLSCMVFNLVQAQIVVNVPKGCAPLEVEFKHNYGNVTNPNWDFGDGSFAVIDFPSHTYVKTGKFLAKFTADGGISDQVEITIFGTPTADFVTLGVLKGCIPLNIQFQDKSVGDGGTNIVKWEWDFGDGGINNTQQNPSYDYTLNGIFSISLVVRDENGCSSTKTLEKHIIASDKPTLTYTSDPSPPSGCIPPLNVTFKGTSKSNSPSGNVLQYFWDFGNGNTSNLQNPPLTTYTETKSYTAKMKVTDDTGCSDSLNIDVLLQNPFADFEIIGAISDTLCKFVTFVDSSKGGLITQIDFGDGSPKEVFDPEEQNKIGHLYAPGTYNINIKTINGICSDDTTKQIVILPLIPDFTAAPVYTCSFPLDVQYTDQSTGATQWLWSFQGGGVSEEQNPKITHNVENTDTFIHEANTGVVLASLTIGNKFGCKESITKGLVNYSIPTARFMPDKVYGCAPLTVNFSDLSGSLEPIVDWEWIFGDGTSVKGTQDEVSHVYSTPGEYLAKLVIINEAGCKDTSYVIHIRVGDKITPDFEIVPAEICLGETFQIKDLTPKPNNIDQIHFQIGNNHPVACPSEGVVNYKPDTLAGSYDIKMQVGWNGCFSEITKPAILKIKGPSAEFKANFDCAKPMEWNFTIQQSESDNWDIDFGDGTVITASTDLNFTHTYAASGDYTVKLKAYGSSGCQPHEFTGVVNVRNLKAIFATDTLGCTRVFHSFDASASTGTGGIGNADGFIWDWGDSTQHIRTEETSYSHMYETGGPKIVRLIVKDVNGCHDTTETKINIFDVKGNFDIVGQQPGCIPGLQITFNDKSLADTTLIKWEWKFDDGNTSTEVSPTHIYNEYPFDSIAFKVSLSLTDTLGCKGGTTKEVFISLPRPRFSVDDFTGCSGKEINFTAQFDNQERYIWDFGDGAVVDTASHKIAHSYNSPGLYEVKLKVIDTAGCIRDSIMTPKINIQKTPLPGFTSTADSLSVLCYPVQVTFKDTTNSPDFGSRIWDLNLDDPNDPTVGTVTVGKNYDKPGIYRVSLTVKTTYGCSSTAYDTINVVGPLADFDFSPGLICKGQTVNFAIKDTVDLFTYKWDFGDGTEAGAVSPIAHQFNFHPPNGKTSISLIYWSKDSICKASTTHELDVHQVIADFKRNNELTGVDTAHCWGTTDLFTDISTSAGTWKWDFGDGNTFDGQFPPTHLYQNAGTYNVSLAISNTTTGCVDTVVKQMVIFPKVDALAQGGIACQGDSIQLMASGGLNYSWTPANYLSNPAIANPKASPPITMAYTVTASNQFGCFDAKTVLAEIIEKPEETTVIIDDLIIGEDTTIDVYQGKYHYYQWAPVNAWISCANCYNPNFKPLETITYTVTITDSLNCFQVPKHYIFIPQKKASVDVPNTFTPNGDDRNDKIYVRGWGIEELLEFKIYNRWGQMVYESQDIDEGWDGTFRGIPQDNDTYVFYVKVKNYIKADPQVLQGYINLVR